MGRRSREKKERRQKAESRWEPFQPATVDGKDVVEVAGESFAVFKNNRYTVLTRKIDCGSEWPGMIHLSIKRNDKEPIHDWRDLQRIKNEIVGPENEGVELYPCESRLADSANQYHLFVMEDPTIRFPFGFRERLLSESNTGGSKQRPWPSDARPSDLRVITEEDMKKAKEKRPGGEGS